MQQRKTSSTHLQPRAQSGDVTKIVPYDAMDEILFSIQDPHAVTRDKMASVARGIFGSAKENDDFIAKLVEHMLAVSESRRKIAGELVVLGGHLQQIMSACIAQQTARVGESPSAEKKAAGMAYAYFHQTLKISRSSAYSYMPCHQRFGDDAEAIALFNYGQLALLSADNVTDEQIEQIKKLKAANGDLTRSQIADLLKTLQRQEEAIDDRDKQLDNIQGLLEDNKVQLDVSIRESNHLKREIADHQRLIAEKDQSLSKLRELLTNRTSGYGSMEKELADKARLVADLTAEMKALREAKPKVETVEVPVEKLPDAYANVSDAVTAALEDLRQAEEQKFALDREISQLRADIASHNAELEADTAVKRSLDDLTTAWADVAGKMATVQLAIQASSEPGQYRATLEALSGMLQKYISEIEAALNR